MEHELKHEDNWNQKQASKPKLLGYYFYNIPSDDRDTAKSYGIKQLQSGKWAMPIYDKSGNSTAYRKRLADDAYGQGKWWEPKAKVNETDVPSTPSNPTSSTGNTATVSAVTPTDITIKTAGGEIKSPINSGAFYKQDGKLMVNKDVILNPKNQTPGSSSQSQLAKAGDKVQINASVDNELDTIKKIAGIS